MWGQLAVTPPEGWGGQQHNHREQVIAHGEQERRQRDVIQQEQQLRSQIENCQSDQEQRKPTGRYAPTGPLLSQTVIHDLDPRV